MRDIVEFLRDRIAEERADHLEGARWDSPQQLRYAEAGRKILDHHYANREGDMCSTCREVGPDAQGWPCDTVKLLAEAFRWHEDYDLAWRP